MIKELDKELLLKVTEKAYKYNETTLRLYRAASHPAISQSSYARGILDGVDNTSYGAFMAGARAMYQILTQNEQTD